MNQNTDLNNNPDNAGLELLQAMYNNNTRQIDILLYQNNELQRAITELVRSNNSIRQNDTRNALHQQNRNVELYQRYGIPMSRRRSENVTRTPNNTIRNRVYPQYVISDILQIPGRTVDVSGNYTTIEQFLEPVNVCPTQQQLDAATRNVRYGDIVRPTNQSCPITLDTFNDNDDVTVIRHCSHVFNTPAINNWFRTNCRCPVCRYDIRTYDSPHNDDTEEQEQEGSEERNLPTNQTLGHWLQNIISNVDISNNHLDASYNQNVAFYFTYGG
jgi:hypothetical protein